jgi:cell division protein ZapA (FtsZ GTPase activity inhibitor)
MSNESGAGNVVSAKIELAGRVYPIKAGKAEIEHIRSIAREVDNKIQDFKRVYPSRDIQDCMAMTLLTYAVDSQGPAGEDVERIHDKLTRAHDLLDGLVQR